MYIDIEKIVQADLDVVWMAWTTARDICKWNAASDDWHTTSAHLELNPGGSFCYRMEAKDGSFGFDFAGRYTRIEPKSRIDYELEDGRTVRTTFQIVEEGVRVSQSFEAEDERSAVQQKEGWQAILDRFSRYAESKARSIR